MKLLYVIEHISTQGGLERIIIDKMNALVCEPEFEVILMTVWQDENGPAFPLDPQVGQVCLGLDRPSSVVGFLATMPRVLHGYNNKVHTIAPDVVVHFRAVGAMLTAFSSWKGYTVFEAHLARQHCNHQWLYPFMERKADVVVCLTKADAMNYSKAKRVEVIPNFTDNVTSVQTRTSYSDEREGGRAIFVGRLCPEKDPLRLLRLWRNIVAKHPAWVLDIFGDGELEGVVRSEIECLGITDSVILHGHVSAMSEVYGSADILLLCSRTEGLPMVLIEAMRSGLPVVSTDCPYGPSDIIEDGETGLLVPLTNDEAFVKAVSALMTDKSLRKRMGERAKKASCKFSKDVIIHRWKKLLLER